MEQRRQLAYKTLVMCRSMSSVLYVLNLSSSLRRRLIMGIFRLHFVVVLVEERLHLMVNVETEIQMLCSDPSGSA